MKRCAVTTEAILYLGLAGRLVSGPEEADTLEASSLTDVREVRIAAFINTVVATRRWGRSGAGPGAGERAGAGAGAEAGV